jgi:hypothetical protein
MLAVGALALWVGVTRGGAPYGPDSANYVEEARSFLAGNGLTSRPRDIGVNGDVRQSPERNFPPGYPIAIAAASAVSGAPAEVVGPWVSRIALVILPLTILLAFRPVIGTYGAACLGILTGLSPTNILSGQRALSDALSLTLVVSSFGLTLAAWSRPQIRRAALFAFGGGMVAGLAYLVRNANVAFLVAAPLSMGAWLLISPLSDKAKTWKLSLSWVLGASILVLPLLARNVMVFGQLQPYKLPPSTVSGWLNLRAFVSAQVADVVGSYHAGMLVGWSVWGLAALLLMAIGFGYLTAKRWSTLENGERRAFIFSLTYALLGAAVVIAARTKYQWGEGISERHVLAFTPFLLLPAAVLLRHLARSKTVAIALSLTIVGALTAVRWHTLPNDASSKLPIVERIQQYRAEGLGACARDSQLVVVSNYAYLYRILCDANARSAGDSGMGGRSMVQALASIRSGIGQRPLVVAFHPGRGIKPSELPIQKGAVDALAADGWTMRDNSPLGVVLAHDPQ